MYYFSRFAFNCYINYKKINCKRFLQVQAEPYARIIVNLGGGCRPTYPRRKVEHAVCALGADGIPAELLWHGEDEIVKLLVAKMAMHQTNKTWP